MSQKMSKVTAVRFPTDNRSLGWSTALSSSLHSAHRTDTRAVYEYVSCKSTKKRAYHLSREINNTANDLVTEENNFTISVWRSW